jgi:predicted transcriptional regulator
MSEILVNKGDLKNIRDTADKLLKSGKENVIGYTQYTSYKSDELSDREKKILKYVENSPGTTKEDVIKYMEKQRICSSSRVTTVKLIKGLIKDGMLIVCPDDSNQHIQHLHVNNEDVVLSLLGDLEFFKQVYFRLIDETAKKLKELLEEVSRKFRENVLLRQFNEGAWMPYSLLGALLMPYKNLIMMGITSDLLLWQERPLDKETLRNKFAILSGSMKEIQTKLQETITPVFSSRSERLLVLNYSLYSLESGLSHQHIISFLREYREVKLGAFAEPVLDILWKISYPVLAHDRLYASVAQEERKDWRNIISANKEFNYIPETAGSTRQKI